MPRKVSPKASKARSPKRAVRKKSPVSHRSSPKRASGKSPRAKKTVGRKASGGSRRASPFRGPKGPRAFCGASSGFYPPTEKIPADAFGDYSDQDDYLAALETPVSPQLRHGSQMDS